MNAKYPLKIQVHVKEGKTKHLVHLEVGLNNNLEGSKNSLAQ